VEMMESEQRVFQQNPQRRYVEVNPAILALQRVIVRQYEQFMQQSSQLEHRQAESEKSRSLAEASVTTASEQTPESSVR
jgi:renierapurpurin 18,18'-hydroxylase